MFITKAQLLLLGQHVLYQSTVTMVIVATERPTKKGRKEGGVGGKGGGKEEGRKVTFIHIYCIVLYCIFISVP